MFLKTRKTVFVLLAGIATAFGGLPSAQAAYVSTWSYSGLAKFSGLNTFGAGGGTQIETDTQVSWGFAGADVFDPDSGDASTNRSGITLATTGPGANDPVALPQVGLVDTDAPPPLGLGIGPYITHHNKPISGTFATLLTSQITSTLTLTPFVPPGAPAPALVFAFDIFFAETPNSAPCTAPSPTPCNDIFALNTVDVFNVAFMYDGFQYFLSTFPIIGGGLSPLALLSNAECAAAGANNGCVGFTTPEDADTTVQFGFVITSQRIFLPEPGTLAMLGLALLTLVAMRRRPARI